MADHFISSFEFWIDSTDIETIHHAKSLGLLHGVTTNPTLLSKSGKTPSKTIENLLGSFDGPLAVQVTAMSHEEMMDQAKRLHQISDRIIVKVPCIQEGYKTMRDLRLLSIPVMATAIYTARQYILAASHGAHYAAPYFSRMIKYLEGTGCTSNQAFQQTIESIKQMLFLSHVRLTKVLLAAIDSPEKFDELLAIGARYATLRADVYQGWIKDFEKTMIDLNNFQKDWEAASYDRDWLKQD